MEESEPIKKAPALEGVTVAPLGSVNKSAAAEALGIKNDDFDGDDDWGAMDTTPAPAASSSAATSGSADSSSSDRPGIASTIYSFSTQYIPEMAREPFRAPAPMTDYELFLSLQRSALFLKVVCVAFTLFSVVSTFLFSQYGYLAAIFVYPIGFFAAFTFKKWIALLFLAGELLDVVVLFAFAYMAGVTYGQLYIVVEFLLLLFKMWLIAFSYRFSQKVPSDSTTFFDKFDPTKHAELERLELNLGDLDDSVA